MRQLTIDGRREDIPERHERMELFDAPKTMSGQMVLRCTICGPETFYPEDRECPDDAAHRMAARAALGLL